MQTGRRVWEWSQQIRTSANKAGEEDQKWANSEKGVKNLPHHQLIRINIIFNHACQILTTMNKK